jgi:hypothetical protein
MPPFVFVDGKTVFFHCFNLLRILRNMQV